MSVTVCVSRLTADFIGPVTPLYSLRRPQISCNFSLFIESKGPRSPTARERATSADSGLFPHLGQTQDVVSKWRQDYARKGLLSRVYAKFIVRLLLFKNNML